MDFRKHHMDGVGADIEDGQFRHGPLEVCGRGDVSDILPFDHIHDKFPNVRRMVSDPFERLGDKRQPDRPGNGSGVFQHEGEKFSKQLFVQFVHEIIVGAHLACERRGPNSRRHPGSL